MEGGFDGEEFPFIKWSIPHVVADTCSVSVCVYTPANVNNDLPLTYLPIDLPKKRNKPVAYLLQHTGDHWRSVNIVYPQRDLSLVFHNWFGILKRMQFLLEQMGPVP
ncbi:hypothetical protein BDB01DRAFT_831556 [Pilobolus umbonatus]|nr:hypothetical protein BDB01DRAFT_831556 [Pilobolus umbonatus]